MPALLGSSPGAVCVGEVWDLFQVLLLTATYAVSTERAALVVECCLLKYNRHKCCM